MLNVPALQHAVGGGEQVIVQHLRLADGHVSTCPKRGTEIDEDLLCQNISKTRFEKLV